MSYDENEGYDQDAARGEFENGLLAEGVYEAGPASAEVSLGYPNGKARCSFGIILYRGGEQIGTHTMYQGLDGSEASVGVTISMLRALGATAPGSDLSAAVQKGADAALLAGLDPANRCKAKVKHESYQGEWKLSVSLFSSGPAQFKDKIPAAARPALARSLLAFDSPQPARRGTPIAPPGARQAAR